MAFKASRIVYLVKIVTLPLSYLRLYFLESSSVFQNWVRNHIVKDSGYTRVFNLDLHIAVIADFTQELKYRKVRLTRFSISSHNHVSSFPLPASDPVRIINQESWTNLDSRLVSEFQHSYRRFLATFDGFIVTYTPAFLQLFSKTDKPILAVAATRYEAPYTGSPKLWEALNEDIKKMVGSGQLTLVANNKGDADYIKFFTGLNIDVVPSYCGGRKTWSGSSTRRFVMARDSKLRGEVQRVTSGLFEPIENLGSPYKWEDLMESLEIFIVPQNISTMTLFELATAGVPVAVPGRKLFRELRESFHGVLDELTFSEIQNLEQDGSLDNPSNYRSERYLDWWLDRSDFYDQTLMPNVRVVESLDDLMISDADIRRRRNEISDQLSNRNSAILRLRHDFITNWTARLGENF
jgi:hypothetical protein